MLHIYPMCSTFYLRSIGTDTRDPQFNVSSKRYPARTLLMKVNGNFGLLLLKARTITLEPKDMVLDVILLGHFIGP